MSQFFPEAETVSLTTGIETQLFRLNDLSGTQIAISKIAPGARLERHAHPDVQVGISLEGEFVMEVGQESRTLMPLQLAYVVEPNQPHAANNHSNAVAIGLDLKFAHIQRSSIVKAQTGSFLTLVHHKTLATGIKMSFFVTPWCEIMLSHIPPGAHMPAHAHKNEQFGIAVKGNYIIEVGEEKETFPFGKIYYSPPNVRHGAYNPFDEEAISLNVFVPPRYNLIPKRERELVE